MNYKNYLRKIKRRKFNSRSHYSESNGVVIKSDFDLIISQVDCHVPMNKESKKIRQLMSKNSMNEEQILSIKKHRVEIAKAQQKKGPLNYEDRKFINSVKLFMKMHSISIFDKNFNSEYNKYINEINNNSFYSFYKLRNLHQPAELYLKLIKLRKGNNI